MTPRKTTPKKTLPCKVDDKVAVTITGYVCRVIGDPNSFIVSYGVDYEEEFYFDNNTEGLTIEVLETSVAWEENDVILDAAGAVFVYRGDGWRTLDPVLYAPQRPFTKLVPEK